MLTEDQERAVKSTARITKVVAGAGSGKTRVIVERVKHLLASGTAPEKILVFTFTQKAAKEIKGRLGDSRVRVGTFHAIALELLNQKSPVVPISEQMVESIVAGINATMKKPIPIKVIQACRINKRLGKSAGTAEIRRAADVLEGRLAHEQAVDYLGMLLGALDLAASLGEFDIVVDEAQDTDETQWALVDALRKDATEFTVGDEAQTIHEWRGIDPKAWPSRPADVTIELGDTFRYGVNIRDLAGEVLGKLGLERPIRTHSDCDGVAVVYPDLHTMLSAVDVLSTGSHSCAILCRYNEQVKNVTEMMRSMGTVVAERVVIDHSAALALFRYLSAPHCGVVHGEFVANKKAAKLLPTLASEELSTESCAIIANGWLDSLPAQTVGTVIDQLKVPDSLKESFNWWNINYATVGLGEAVRDFVTLENADYFTPGVHVMTIHTAKGLEWDSVFCVFPSVRRFSEEEWRLGYVALTRGRKNVGVVGENNPVVELVEQWVEKVPA